MVDIFLNASQTGGDRSTEDEDLRLAMELYEAELKQMGGTQVFPTERPPQVDNSKNGQGRLWNGVTLKLPLWISR